MHLVLELVLVQCSSHGWSFELQSLKERKRPAPEETHGSNWVHFFTHVASGGGGLELSKMGKEQESAGLKLSVRAYVRAVITQKLFLALFYLDILVSCSALPD